VIDLLTDLFRRPGYQFEHEDRALVRAVIEAQWLSGRWVLMRSPSGEFWGWMAWVRTDAVGAALIRDYGLFNLIFLALPIPPAGPVVALLFDVISPRAPFMTIAALWHLMKHANPDAESMASFLSTRRGTRWVTRRLK
jgi:hypothetical protein